MDTLDAVSDNPIHDYITGIVISFEWLVFITILMVVYSYSPKSTEKWSKPLYYNFESKVGKKFIHVVRLIFETPTAKKPIKDTLLLMTLYKEGDPKALFKVLLDNSRLKDWTQFSESEPNKSVIRFLLFTSYSIESMDSIVLNLQSSGDIHVFNVEIQNITESEANVAQIGIPIKKLSNLKSSTDQSFHIFTKRFRELEASANTSRLLTAYEYLLFIWMSCNLSAFIPSVLIVCSGPQVLCDDYNYDFTSSVYTGLTASLLSALFFFTLIGIFRFAIKYKLEKSFGSSLWSIIRYLYLFLIFGIGFCAGILTVVCVAQHRHSGIEHILEADYAIFWLVSTVIATFALILFWVPILALLANCFNFFTKKEDPTDMEAFDSKPKPKDMSPQKTDKSPDQSKKSDKTEDQQMTEESDNYFQTLVKGGGRVKSISQYKGQQTKRQTDESDQQSVGDKYFNEVVKGKEKVTSVSQYGNQK